MVQLIHKFVPRSRIGIFHNEHTRSTPLDPKWMYWCVLSVWVHFGWFHYCMKLGKKRAELEQLMEKFVPRSRIGIFCSEPTRSNPLHPKLMFWCVPYHFGAFGTIRLPYETRCKTGRISAKVCATKSRRTFSQRTHPIQPVGP